MKQVIILSISFLLSACASEEWKDPDDHIKEKGQYCYPTLGGVDCYKRPIKRNLRQTVGYEGPPPPVSVKE
jgi:hypothetical protein